LARVLSKLGVCSRSEAAGRIAAGRVTVEGRVIRDAEFPVVRGKHRIAIDGVDVTAGERIHLMLNKPRGLVTSARDERDRDTVYRCFDGAGLPWIAPVGRLDKASEGLLLFSNDPEWAARITDPEAGPHKAYHVQVDRIPDPSLLARLLTGTIVDEETLRVQSVELLRQGEKNAWLEIVLDEGRNRQIRRLLAAFDLGVLRLIRVSIGQLLLGDLPKGHWRRLSPDEIVALSSTRPMRERR
jgi:23S rRNA pseudouridine2605 synthase